MQPLRGMLAPLTQASGKPFVPSDLANLALWLKADALTLNDGDAISTWTDSSGNGRNATGTTTTRPLYKTNIVNSKPVVRFDGVDDFLQLSDAPFDFLSAASSTFTVFIVAAHANASTGVLLGKQAAFDQPGMGIRYNAAKFNYIEVGNTSGSALYNKQTADLTTSAWYVLTVKKSGSTINLYRNGTSDTNNGVEGGSGNAANNELLYIGKRSNGLFLNGDVAEIVTYTTALDDYDRNKVQSHLGTKYGISIA